VAFLQTLVNRARRFFATVADKLEIAGEFVLLSNKFGLTLATPNAVLCRCLQIRRGERIGQKAGRGVMKIERRLASGLRPKVRGDLGDLVANLARTLFDPYRPELHYMRGPGPKWHAKHEPSDMGGTAALVPVRVRH
jgi:hypothetical protein